jgi:hypothetical protein
MALTPELAKRLSGALRLALFGSEHEPTAALGGLRRMAANNGLGPDDVGVVSGGMEALGLAVAERAGATGGDADKLASDIAALVAGGEELYTKTQLLELAGQYQALIDQRTAAQGASAALWGAGVSGADCGEIADALRKAEFIMARLGYLNAWERNFAQSVHGQLQDPFYNLSPKQAVIFRKVYVKCGGVI